MSKNLVLINGKYCVVEGTKELRQRKNYSLPNDTINKVKAIAKQLDCSESEAIVKLVDIVAKDLIISEEAEAPTTEEIQEEKAVKPKRTSKKKEDKTEEDTTKGA